MAIVSISIIYIEIVEISTQFKAADEQRTSPETGNETELEDLILFENLGAEIVVLGLAVDRQRLPTQHLVLYHDGRVPEDGILVESRYCRRPVYSKTRAFY